MFMPLSRFGIVWNNQFCKNTQVKQTFPAKSLKLMELLNAVPYDLAASLSNFSRFLIVASSWDGLQESTCKRRRFEYYNKRCCAWRSIFFISLRKIVNCWLLLKCTMQSTWYNPVVHAQHAPFHRCEDGNVSPWSTHQILPCMGDAHGCSILDMIISFHSLFINDMMHVTLYSNMAAGDSLYFCIEKLLSTIFALYISVCISLSIEFKNNV